MGIFGNSYRQTEADIQVEVLEGYGHEVNGELRIIREGFEDQLEVVKALHAIDMAEIQGVQEGATEMTAVLEGAMGNAWTKIKEFFKKMMQKLKSYFAALVRMFDGLTKSGKDFVKKYEKELRRLDLDGFEVKMHKYDDAEIENGSKIAGAFDRVSKHINGMSDELVKKKSNEDFEEAIRGVILGGGKLSTSDYSEKLFANFRNGATSDSDMKEISPAIGSIIKTLSDTKAAKTAADAEKVMTKVFTEQIKECEKLEKMIAKGKDMASQQEDLKLAQGEISLFNTAKTEALKFFSAWTKAVKEREGAYKRVCTKAFSYKKKDK